MPPPPPGQRGAKRSRWAIATLIFGICGLIVPFVGGGLALFLGFIALITIFVSDGAKRGMGMAITGMVVASMGLVGWAFLFTSDGVLDSLKERFEEAIDDVVAQTSASSLFDVGDCVDMTIADRAPLDLSSAKTVPCEGVHTLEYVGFRLLPYSDDADYPGGDVLLEEGAEICIDQFGAYVGYSYYEQTSLDIFVKYPQSRSWRILDDREIGCFIVMPDLSPLIGSVKSADTAPNRLGFDGFAIIEEGSVTADASARYDIELSAGDEIAVRAVSFDLTMDPYLTLRDSSEEILAENDDESDGSPNSLVTFTAPVTATYTINVSDAEFAAGNFVLSVSTVPTS